MKKIIVIAICLLATQFIVAQRELDSLNYKNTQDINFFKKIKNRTLVKKYTTLNKNVIKIGDTVILGSPTSQEINSRTYGGSYGRNARLSIANTRSTSKKTYEFIQLGRPAGFGTIMSAMNGDAPSMAGIQLKGTKAIVKEIKAYHRGSRKKPLKLIMVLGEINGRAFGINKFLSVMDTELGIETGEILLKNRKMTREEAIFKLKEAKELLEVEVISKKDFDSIKKKLTPIIMKKNLE
ncbi:MAG: hypothetical protein ABF247_09450 [Nonlabens sp.]|uniref:hypothetical protein n=1 Tax=Nonlabens sp. TaxID=1888209 RepID=UPI0032190934